MIPKKLTVCGNVPLSIGGVYKLTIDLESRSICVIGENGSGKSTLLRILTPEPPISTLYNPGGYVEIVWAHPGAEYITRSQFDDTALHSFKKDGVELNISGNSKVQLELCKEHFSYDGAIKEFSRGVVDIVNMGPAQRKSLFMSLYPSDLSFVEDAHKNVIRKLKNARAVREDLIARITAIVSSALSKEELDLLKDTIEFYKNAISSVTSNLSIVNSKLDEFGTIDQSIRKTYPETLRKIKALTDEYHRLTLGASGTANRKLMALMSELDTSLGADLATIDSLKAAAHVASIDLHETEDSLAKSSTWKIDELYSELAIYKKQLETLAIIPDKADVLNPQLLLVDTEKLASDIAVCVACLLETHVLGDELTALKERVSVNTMKVSNVEIQISTLNNKIDTLHGELERADAFQFREGCILTCPMKDATEERKQCINKEIEECNSKLKQACIELSTLICSVETDSELLKYSLQAKESLYPIYKLHRSLYPSEPFETTRDFVLSFGQRVVFEQSRLIAYNKYTKLTESVSILEDRINTAKALEGNIEALEARRNKQVKAIEDITVSIENISERVEVSKSDRKRSASILNIRTSLISLYRKAASENVTFCNAIECSKLTELRRFLIHCQSTLVRDLKTMEESYDKSLRYQIRLDEELRPALASTELQLYQLEKIEKEVSPTTGIIRTALVEYTNEILNRTNEILRSLAAYPMELDTLDVAVEELEFKFPIRLHDANNSVPDIKLLSTGQGAICNFAMYLACMEIRGLLRDYTLKIDEIDAGWSYGHKERLISTVATIMNGTEATQMILVNHHPTVYTALHDLAVICLDSSGVILPKKFNVGVEIERH